MLNKKRESKSGTATQQEEDKQKRNGDANQPEEGPTNFTMAAFVEGARFHKC